MAPRVTFPLPENYFRPVELTRRDEEQFQAWALALVDETLAGFTKDQYMSKERRERKWKPLKQRDDLCVYRRRKGTEEEDDEYRYLCTGTVDGSLDEVMLGRYADNTDMFRRMSAIYREDLVDCVVLHTIERQSPEKPFFFCGFKWMTVKSPGKGLVKNRDVCWFEQSGLTRDHKGKEIGYHIAQSVDLDACPAFDESVCVRARLSACYLFRRNKSGGTKVFMRGKNNPGGKVLDYIADMKSADLWLRCVRALDCTMAYVSTEMVRAAQPESVYATPVLGSNHRCEVCAEKTTGMMVSQKQCSVCHRVTCSRCVVKRRVLSSARDFLADQRVNFCKRCVRFFNEIRHRDPQSIAMACAAAAARAEPHGGGSLSSASRGYSQSSQASSESDGFRDPQWSYASSSSTDHANVRSATNSGRIPPSPASMRMARQDSNRSVGPATPIVLYEEAPSSSRGRPQPKVLEKMGVRRLADSEASTVASSVNSLVLRNNTFQSHASGHASFASEYSSYSYAESTDSNDAYMYRDTTDASPNQSFQKHLEGSYAYHGTNARLGSTDEMSPPPLKTPSSYSTPEEMMQQMIRMNIMAEQARQMVKDNDKFTRKFNFY